MSQIRNNLIVTTGFPWMYEHEQVSDMYLEDHLFLNGRLTNLQHFYSQWKWSQVPEM